MKYFSSARSESIFTDGKIAPTFIHDLELFVSLSSSTEGAGVRSRFSFSLKASSRAWYSCSILSFSSLIFFPLAILGLISAKLPPNLYGHHNQSCSARLSGQQLVSTLKFA